MLDQVAQEQHGGQRRDDLQHEDHRVLDQRRRVEFDEGLPDRWQHDLQIEHRRGGEALAHF